MGRLTAPARHSRGSAVGSAPRATESGAIDATIPNPSLPAAGGVRVLAPCPDWPQPAGGVRKIYRHVDVLNGAGVEAMVVHQQRGFRCEWFENTTNVVCHDDIWPPRSSDILLVTEGLAWQMMSLAPGVRKVIFNQNAYQTFMGAVTDEHLRQAPYRHPDMLASIVVSEDSRRYLNYVFPGHPVHRLHNSIDPKLFHPAPVKSPRIVFMPRKKKEDAAQVLGILHFRGAMRGFEAMGVMNQPEAETARILRESAVFMCLSTYEGSPMPPLEALACGCVVVGYQGRGGAEYVNNQYAFPVEAEDIMGFARTLEQVLEGLRTNPGPLLEKARRASQWVLETYTPAREAQDILDAWRQILGAAK